MFKFFNNKRILFHSSLHWDFSCQPFATLYAKELSKTNEIYWINPGSMNPRRVKLETDKESNVKVLTPFMLKDSIPNSHKLNGHLLKLQLKVLLPKRAPDETIYWNAYQSNASLLHHMNSNEFCIYDTGDLFEPEREVEDLKRYNLVMPCTEQKQVFCSKHFGHKTLLSTMGVNFDYFSKIFDDENFIKPKEMENIQSPIAGFIGGVNTNRIDFELLEEAIKSCKDINFVLIGPILNPAETKPVIDRLKKEHLNFFWIGSQPNTEVPRFIRCFDIGIIPYKLNKFNIGSNPNKLYEYFAMGLKTVSTQIPSLEKFSDLAGWLSKENFARGVKEETSKKETPGSMQKRRDLALKFSPPKILERIECFILERKLN